LYYIEIPVGFQASIYIEIPVGFQASMYIFRFLYLILLHALLRTIIFSEMKSRVVSKKSTDVSEEKICAWRAMLHTSSLLPCLTSPGLNKEATYSSEL
jgi:hypothetical protein